tara:strand:+ start:37 stop:924 length:888 start_codon:yes stop_codon:yes gene_type:complete
MPDPLAFSGSPLDRAEPLRRNEADIRAVEARPDARRIVLKDGEPLVTLDGSLVRLAMDDPAFPPSGEVILLGFDRETPLFAADCAEEGEPFEDNRFSDPRAAAMRLAPSETAIFAQARSLLLWRERHRFCSACGAASRQVAGGQKRVCDGCNSEHFPRTDPVVIMLATRDDSCLLGRQAAWPPQMWSALAGFVEIGETIEEACARELFEESGVEIDVASVRYVASQPWPFPSSLMIGLIAPATSTQITVDENELETARWFSRAEVQAMLEGTHPDVDVPPKIAIARRLLEVWAGS